MDKISRDRLFKLHMEFVWLCVDGIINEDQHEILNTALDAVLESILEISDDPESH